MLKWESFEFPPFTVFETRELAKELAEWKFRTWQALEQPSDSTQVLLSFATGDTFLATQPYGRGRVYQCSVSGDDRWSNLPLRSSYVPFIQQLTLSAAHETQAANVNCGESVIISIRPAQDKQGAPLAQNNSQPQLWARLLDPLKALEEPREHQLPEHQLQVDEAIGSAVWRDTRYPGLFQFHVADGGEAVTPQSSSPYVLEPPLASVGLSAGESRLEVMSDSQMDALADRLGATLIESAEEFSESDRLRRVGREIWTWLLGALLFLLVGEVFFVRLLTRGAGG
jgi:hypothetical protein